jgi:hypothetical protein
MAIDRYATGAMLYQLVTGNSPMDLLAEAPSSSRCNAFPTVLRPALQAACSADLAGRFAGTRQMADALQATLSDEPPVCPRSNEPPEPQLPIAEAIQPVQQINATPTTAIAPPAPHASQSAQTAPTSLAAPPTAPTDAGPPSPREDQRRGSLDGYAATLHVSSPIDSLRSVLTWREISYDWYGQLITTRARLSGSDGTCIMPRAPQVSARSWCSRQPVHDPAERARSARCLHHPIVPGESR